MSSGAVAIPMVDQCNACSYPIRPGESACGRCGESVAVFELTGGGEDGQPDQRRQLCEFMLGGVRCPYPASASDPGSLVVRWCSLHGTAGARDAETVESMQAKRRDPASELARHRQRRGLSSRDMLARYLADAGPEPGESREAWIERLRVEAGGRPDGSLQAPIEAPSGQPRQTGQRSPEARARFAARVVARYRRALLEEFNTGDEAARELAALLERELLAELKITKDGRIAA